MNGEDLPLLNGYPLGLVFGGLPGSTSGKWLERIVIRNKVHDGTKMGGYSYRIPQYPVAPGTVVAKENMRIIESMPVKSLITYPRSGSIINKDEALIGLYKHNHPCILLIIFKLSLFLFYLLITIY